MDFTNALDTFFSSGWISFGTLLGLLTVGIVFRKPLFQRRKQKKTLAIIYFTIFLGGFLAIILINPMYWGYGRSSGVKNSTYADGSLYVMDYRLGGGSDTEDPIPFYRINAVDAASGLKLFRFVVGSYGQIIFVSKNEIVCKEYEEIVFYSRKDGSKVASWSKETLPELFPELAAGIDNFEMDLFDASLPVLRVTTLDGKSWQLYLPDRRIWGEKPVPPLPPLYWKIENDRLVREGMTALRLKGKNGEDKRKQVCLPNDSVPNPSLFFIEGCFIGADKQNQCAVILHYETTNHTGWMLSGISLDGKRELWKHRESEIRDSRSDFPLENCWSEDEQNGLVFFTSKDETYCLRMKDGTVLWRRKL